ncbi:MAG: 50S ribosomal protein L3 [Candidatus Omnitrophica bacterium]|nr:50S ribosomal protein L3 [Candidatus Omnitrophota bacterium]MDD5487398.1 50S ribosomal protein L3 [Candidatus Omnitrophota bacterium]
MVPGILGKKIGMTQIFREDGEKVPVTVLEVGPCQVQAVKVKEKDGYNAVQMGYEDTKEARLNKPQREYVKAQNIKPKKFVREIRTQDAPEVKVGDEITSVIIQKGDYLDIIGTSKGKGFQGGMKRHNWNGGGAAHGSMSHRAPGSIGSSSYPSRVFKGLRMAGHMGSDQTTTQNLEVVDVDPGKNIVAVKGAVPGANGTYLVIKYAKKKPIAPRVEEKAEDKEENKEGKE